MTLIDPPFSHSVDGVRGRITPLSQLTAQGVELIRGTAEALHDSGHALITVDLRHVAVQGAALEPLRALDRDLRARDARLVVLPPRTDQAP